MSDKNQKTKYNISVKTSDVSNAGTDSKVSITIFSNNTNTGEIVLDKAVSKKQQDLFERGGLDEFEIEALDVKKISHIKIGHDGTKLAADWHLGSVTVKSKSETQAWEVNQLLDKSNNTNMIELKAKEIPKESPKESPKENSKNNSTNVILKAVKNPKESSKGHQSPKGSESDEDLNDENIKDHVSDTKTLTKKSVNHSESRISDSNSNVLNSDVENNNDEKYPDQTQNSADNEDTEDKTNDERDESTKSEGKNSQLNSNRSRLTDQSEQEEDEVKVSTGKNSKTSNKSVDKSVSSKKSVPKSNTPLLQSTARTESRESINKTPKSDRSLVTVSPIGVDNDADQLNISSQKDDNGQSGKETEGEEDDENETSTSRIKIKTPRSSTSSSKTKSTKNDLDKNEDEIDNENETKTYDSENKPFVRLNRKKLNYSNGKKPESRRSKDNNQLKMPQLTQEFTQVELKRIKDSLNREVSKIRFPRRQDNKPYVFNDLNPYYDVRHVESLINAPENTQPIGYYNRYTAMNIVEPWVAHRMEHTVAPIISRSLSHNMSYRSQVGSDLSDRPNKDQLEGSTLAPNFPKIIIKKPKNMNGPFYVDDIKVIRKELANNLSNDTRFEEDRNRTINDYYRMNLYQTAEKERMTDAYHAYLENSPGSKKALKELLDKQRSKNSGSEGSGNAKRANNDTASNTSVEVE